MYALANDERPALQFALTLAGATLWPLALAAGVLFVIGVVLYALVMMPVWLVAALRRGAPR